MIKRIIIMLAGLASAFGIALATAGAASASYGHGAEYQIAFSQNCNNASSPYCSGGTGGAWGWAVLNTDRTGDLQITLCQHGYGAQHFSVDISSWGVDTSQTPPVFTLTTNNSMFNGDSPIPAAPGHYSEHPAPGVSMEIQVTKIP